MNVYTVKRLSTSGDFSHLINLFATKEFLYPAVFPIGFRVTDFYDRILWSFGLYFFYFVMQLHCIG